MLFEVRFVLFELRFVLFELRFVLFELRFVLFELQFVLFELRPGLFTQFRLDVLLIIWSGHIESPLSGSHVKTGLWRRFNIVNSQMSERR